jgi:uncharacterized phosphosugar-binding protein
MEHYQIASADALIIVSNSGRNAAIVELSKLAKAQGTLVVGVVSRSHAAATDSRNSDGTKLIDHADLIIDNHGVPGDAVIELVTDMRTGSTSTIAGALIMQLLVTRIFSLAEGRYRPMLSANIGN